MECGKNAPPMHSNCHCATAPHYDSKSFYEWLDARQSGKTEVNFENWSKNRTMESKPLAVRSGHIHGLVVRGNDEISKQTQRLIDQTVHKLFGEMPKLQTDIIRLSFENLGDDIARASINKKFEMTLKLNKSIFSNDTVLKEICENTPSEISKKDGLYGYLKHEFTHFLEYKYCISRGMDVEQTWEAISSGKYATELLEEALKNCNLENEYGIIKSQISYLGTFNSSEAIAEAYSSCLDTNLTSTIKKLVEKKWR